MLWEDVVKQLPLLQQLSQLVGEGARLHPVQLFADLLKAWPGVGVRQLAGVAQAPHLNRSVKPLLGHFTTGESNSPPKYLRTLKKCQTRELPVEPLRRHRTPGDTFQLKGRNRHRQPPV
eukprot:1184807-Prorocentrum_minimum.AAC.2